MKRSCVIFFIALYVFLPSSSAADTYMSLRSNMINMRVGPGKFYPILWTYTARGLPVKVIGQHNEWIQIEDMDGESGWMYQRLLSSTRTAVIEADGALLHRHPDNNSGVIAKLMKQVIIVPTICRATWCKITISRDSHVIKGWIRKSVLWGIEAHDLFEEK